MPVSGKQGINFLGSLETLFAYFPWVILVMNVQLYDTRRRTATVSMNEGVNPIYSLVARLCEMREIPHRRWWLVGERIAARRAVIQG